jgi:hypothetical protein
VCGDRAQRRPTIDFELKQLPHAFSCIVPSADPNVIALGDTHGNVVEIDLRNKNIKGLYRGTHTFFFSKQFNEIVLFYYFILICC